MKSHKLLSLIAAISFSLLCAFSVSPVLAASAAYPAGTPVIKNESKLLPPPEVVELEEMWRAGGEDSEVLFGHIFRALADSEDNVYLLDTQLSEVQVFSPSGDHLKTLSREGEGPGESREPADLTMMPDQTLGILQRFPGKVVKVTLDGIPAGDVALGDAASGGFNALYTGRCSGSNLLLVAQYVTRDDNGQTRIWYVSRFDAEGNELARCWERATAVDFANPVIREADILDPVIFACEAASDGRVYLAPDRYNYAVHVYDPDGSLHHVIEREFQVRHRNEMEIGRVQSVFDVWTSGRPVAPETEVETIATTISALYVDDQNSLWVENSRSAQAGPAGAMFTYDIFSEDGKFDRQVTFSCEGNHEDDQLFRVSDDMVVLIKGSIPAIYASMAGGAQDIDEDMEAEMMEVICFRIPH